MDIDDKQHYAKKAIIIIEQQEREIKCNRQEWECMASIRDVVKMAGVSVGTISRYLNGRQLKEKNMKRIAEAISALDYKENIIARGLKNNRSFSIGLLINGISSRFGSEVVSGIEKVAKENGYSLLSSGFADQPEKIKQKIEYLMKHVIDGLIISLSEGE